MVKPGADRRALAVGGVVLGAAALGASIAAGARCARAIRAHMGRARVKTIALADGSRARVLERGGVYQSATYTDERWTEPVFAYYRGFDAMFDAEAAMRVYAGHGIDRVLMLGGGGFAYPKHALTAREELAMDVMEIDPDMVKLARRYFFLDRLEAMAQSRLHISVEDGRAFLSRAAAGGIRYDAVINDCFAGAEPVRSLATVEAMRAAKAILTKDGIYQANIVSRNDGADVSFLRSCVASALKVFAHVWVLQTSDEELGGEDNYLLIASDAAYDFPAAIPYDRDFLGDILHD